MDQSLTGLEGLITVPNQSLAEDYPMLTQKKLLGFQA